MRNQAIYLGGVLLIASAPIVYGVVISEKLSDAATAEEVTQDINTLTKSKEIDNENAPRLRGRGLGFTANLILLNAKKRR